MNAIVSNDRVNDTRADWWPKACVFAVIAMFVCLSIVRFLSAGRDDSIIVLWSGKTFTFTNWFINYNGANEELSSSIIGPLIAAAAYKLTPQTPLIFTKFVSLAASVYLLYLLWRNRSKIFPQDLPPHFILIALLSVALSPIFQYWTLGGLETAYQALLFLIAPLAQVRFYFDKSRANGLMLALSLFAISLVRTEGFIYTITSLSFLVVIRERNWRYWVTPILVAVSLTFLMFLIRFLFTGALWPNPTYAKIGGLFDQLTYGFSYLAGYYARPEPFAWLQLLGLVSTIINLFYFTFLRKRDAALTALSLSTISFSLFVVLHEAFILFSGGDWMEYYRFIVPTVALKVVVLVNSIWLARKWATRLQGRAREITIYTAAAVLGASAAYQQTYSLHGRYENNCALPMTDVPLTALFLSPLRLEREIVRHNCANGRDEVAVLPFIEHELAHYVDRAGQIRLATPQAGYFPYQIRERFSADRVFFIDTLGLANLAIARAGTKGAQVGIADGGEIDRILAGKAGKVSDVVLSMNPNMVYQLGATPEQRENFRRLGYNLVWDRPNAVVFLKESE